MQNVDDRIDRLSTNLQELKLAFKGDDIDALLVVLESELDAIDLDRDITDSVTASIAFLFSSRTRP